MFERSKFLSKEKIHLLEACYQLSKAYRFNKKVYSVGIRKINGEFALHIRCHDSIDPVQEFFGLKVYRNYT